MGRAELFPRDRRLTVQMVLASVLTPLVVVALLVLLVPKLSGTARFMFAVVVVIGISSILREARRAPRGRIVTEAEQPELVALVDRLCLIADLPRPQIVLEPERQPNSWIIAPPRRAPRLHVTEGLLALLDTDELAAVLAHELSHVANRDAAVMTLVGGPALALRASAGRGRFWWAGGALAVAVVVEVISSIGSCSLSRCRELAADRGAAAITGRPSALASALLKTSGALAGTPAADLRAVATRDSFHLVPVARSTRWYERSALGRRLMATHPSLERRLEALEALEHHAQHARRAIDPSETL